jgi:hypothetical protein
VANDLVSYRDSGGLWRMGHEFRGGWLRESGRASDRPARLVVEPVPGGLEVTCQAELDGLPVLRRYWFRADSPILRLRVEGRAADRRTITVRFRTGLAARRLAMDQPGGVVVRPLTRIYEPTFWPLQHFLHAQDDGDGRGAALWLRRPGAAACRPGGWLEAVALRNATRERAWGVVPIIATPAVGHERSVTTFDYAVWFTAAGDWRENGVALVAGDLASGPWAQPGGGDLAGLAATVVTTDRADVAVTAVKPASRGEGIIVRLQTFAPPGSPVVVAAPGRSVDAATLCDARERDLQPLEVRDGAVRLVMPGTIATVRLLFAFCVLTSQPLGNIIASSDRLIN